MSSSCLVGEHQPTSIIFVVSNPLSCASSLPDLQVLNDCPGGYAVGIAGFVALLPYSRAKPETVEDVGSSQTFEIVSMDDARKRIVVGDFRRKQ